MDAKPLCRKWICLLEFGNGHVECLYSQAAFLKDAGYTVLLIARERFSGRYADFDVIDSFYWIADDPEMKNLFATALEIRQVLRARGICKVVVNTYSGSLLKLLLPLLATCRIAALIHDVGGYRRSFWRRYLAFNVKHFFLLNDYLLPKMPGGLNGRTSSFYPIFFPKFQPCGVEKPANEFWVCIPGQLEFKRRDYGFLLKQLSRELNPAVRFVLLGSSRHAHGDREAFESLAASLNISLDLRFYLFDDFVEDALFHAYVSRSDVILPLVFDIDRYMSSAISGAYNLSFSYKIPMLASDNTLSITDLREYALWYNGGNFIDLLNELSTNCESLNTSRLKMQQAAKFSYQFQCDNYIQYIDRL